MTQAKPTKKKVFVLMPFDDAFTEIYDKLIKESFEQAGYSVYRADDIESQQNILNDIIVAISTADVVIADLTDSNPNVYYELGLAHALLKPVVLLSQDIASIPFDLRSYRVIEYDTHFARFGDARQKLKQLADQIANDNVVFGNPVSDFGPRKTASAESSGAPATGTRTAAKKDVEEIDSDEPGFLDGIIESEDKFHEMTKLVERAGELVQEMGDLAREATPVIEEAVKAGNNRLARSVLQTLGGKYRAHGDEFQDLNTNFDIVLVQVSDSLEVVLKYIRDTNQTGDPNFKEFLEEIHKVEVVSRAEKGAMAALVQTMTSIPRLERGFDKAKKILIRELERFIDNTDNLTSIIYRIRNVSEEDGNNA